MIFYNIFFISMIVLFIICQKIKIPKFLAKYNRKELYLLITFIILFLISSLRGSDVGTDTKTYMTMFNEIGINDIKSFSSMEPLFYLLNLVTYFISSNSHAIIFVMSLITIFSFGLYTFHFSKDYLLSVIIFLGLGYYFLTFNISRQMLGFAMILFSLYFYQKNDNKLSILFLIFAVLTHYSMLVWVPFYIFSYFKINTKKLLMIICSLPIFVIFFLLIFNKIVVFTHYFVYLDETISRSLPYYLFFCFKLFCLCLFFYKRKNEYLDKGNMILIYSLLINLIIDILTIRYSYFARLTYCVEPYLIITIPLLIREKFGDKYKILCYIFFVLVGFVFINTVIDNNSFFGIVPYNMIFDFCFGGLT